MAFECLVDPNNGIANSVNNLEKTQNVFKVNVGVKALE